MYPSEMRLLPVTWKWKEARAEGGNYYYRCENVKAEKVEGDARSFFPFKKKRDIMSSEGWLLLTLEGDPFYDYYTDIIMLFSRLV